MRLLPGWTVDVTEMYERVPRYRQGSIMGHLLRNTKAVAETASIARTFLWSSNKSDT